VSSRDCRKLCTNANHKTHNPTVWPGSSTGWCIFNLCSRVLSSCFCYFSSSKLLALCLCWSRPVLCNGICSLDIGKFWKGVRAPCQFQLSEESICLIEYSWWPTEYLWCSKSSIGLCLIPSLLALFLMHAAFLAAANCPFPQSSPPCAVPVTHLSTLHSSSFAVHPSPSVLSLPEDPF
jgi:hypothetical protein